MFSKYRQNEAKKREVLSAAAAAGVSVAFGAPVGGVLFSLEEVSYYFPHKTMWRAFFAALVGAVVLSQMNPFLSGHLVKFYVQFDYPWHYFEILPFALLGFLGGIYGAFFNHFNLKYSAFRKAHLAKKGLLEVVVITIATALLRYPNPLTRTSTSDLIASLFAECDRNDDTMLCNSDDKTLVPLLFAALVLVAALTIFTFGMKVGRQRSLGRRCASVRLPLTLFLVPGPFGPLYPHAGCWCHYGSYYRHCNGSHCFVSR